MSAPTYNQPERNQAMAHDEIPSSKSDNRKFDDVIANRLGRRKVMAGGLAAATTSFLLASPANAVLPKQSSRPYENDQPDHNNYEDQGQDGNGQLIDFEAIPLGSGPEPAISPDYQYSVLAPWGTLLARNGSEFSYPPDAETQEQQVGIGHDGMWFFPTGRGDARNKQGLLCINHEYGTNPHVLGKELPESLDDVQTSQAAHGVSIIEICKNRGGEWEVVPGRKSRRITVNTPVEFSGPVADSKLLQNDAGNEPMGTVNNCSNGHTPWGTYLTCEENFNGYFAATYEWAPDEAQDRYGITDIGFVYGWEKFDPRFDLSNTQYRNEQNRFGWIVEIDPFDRRSKPVKRTAMGRFKHEGVALTIGSDDRAVAYMGDDQRFDYIYKFVSADNYRHMLQRGESPLDHGQLYAARFDDDGTGEWLELSIENPALEEAFGDQAEVLTFARQAADVLGATPMDRPEWTTVAPNGDVYCTLTNNDDREEPNTANPQVPNTEGHIIKWRDADYHIGTTFEWDIFLLASETQETEDGFGSPDGIWADPDGRLFIQTDGDQPDEANNQMLVADTQTGELRRLFSGVPGCEITGLTATPDRRTMFINIQHPGDGDPAVSLFPDYENGVIPRDATIVITKKDGGIIGS